MLAKVSKTLEEEVGKAPGWGGGVQSLGFWGLGVLGLNPKPGLGYSGCRVSVLEFRRKSARPGARPGRVLWGLGFRVCLKVVCLGFRV